MKPDDELLESSNAAPAEARFDALFRLAKRLCGVTLARIATDTHLSGSTEPEQRLPAALDAYLQELIARTGLGHSPLLLPDTRLDTAPQAAPSPGFFVGYPLRSVDGGYLGVFYLADGEPQRLSDEQLLALDDIAESAANLLEQIRREAAARQASEALLAQESRMALAIQGSGTGIWDRDVVTGEIHYSSAWKALLGYADHEVSNRIEDSYGRVHPDDRTYVQQAVLAHFAGHTESYEVEHRLRCRDGSYKWVCSRGKVVARDERGNALRMLGTTTDITALRELSERLQRSVELITRLTDQVPGMVFQFRSLPDSSGYFTYLSAGVYDMFEATREQIDRDPEILHTLVHPDDMETYQMARLRAERELSTWHIEYRVILPRQGLRWRLGEARPQREADGSIVWHGVVTDITERKRIESELQEFASLDALTQLPNRRVFMAHLETELARIQRSDVFTSTLLMCDLDHFKLVNDKWGHAIGDQALRHFSRILREQLRKSDLAGRVGGEEFAVVLSGAGLIQARDFACRVQHSLKDEPLNIEGKKIHLTLSVGIALLERQDTTPDTVLCRSDAALYRAKKNGRNRVEVG
ncbi:MULTISPECIES: diguanylate cyclase [Pseudomonas]|uniref:Diguanylate cyclase n=1 Tax=Pseudomonas fulva TaxID=47880 RepID=A0A0D0JZW2_9PSED|nr:MULTISPECIES: diguanylate cyclase [Pseudomonas]KIP90440.1 diguanylate cyclase [Pseudomonas fulva]